MGCRPAGPPSYLEREVRQVAPNSTVQWNGEIGRWEVHQRGPDGQSRVLRVVQGPNGEYRPPDMRVVYDLYSTSIKRYRREKDCLRHLDNVQRVSAEKRKAEVNEEFDGGLRDSTRAHKLALHSVSLDGHGLETAEGSQ